MTAKNQESISDIVSEMREFADTDSQTIGRDVLRKRIQDFSRRIEQSVTDCNRIGNFAKILEALELIHELLGIKGKPDTAMCIRYEAAYQIAKEALFSTHNREFEAIIEKSSINGNVAKMREALEKFNAVDLSWLEFPLDGDSSTIYNSNKKEITIPYWRVAELLNEVKAAQDMANSALSAPPRNCDVGTADEQAKLFHSFCEKFQSCIQEMCSPLCPFINCCDVCHCMTKWLQIPYKEGEK